jgi:hypothetical protein
MRKVAFVDSNTAVSDGTKLTSEILETLKEHAWERNFYSALDPSLGEQGYIEQ